MSFRIHVRFVLMLAAVGMLSSCSDILEPSPAVSKSVHPPSQVLTKVDIRGYQPGQHVAGSITLKFDGLPMSPKPALSTLNLTPSLLLTSTSMPPSFTFAAVGLPEGALHVQLKLYVESDPSLGLLNLVSQSEFAAATTAVLDTTIPLIVDHRPPTEVSQVGMDWPWNPTISWGANTDLNFKAYFIRRLTPTSRLDTVFQQSRTSLTDSTQLPYLGAPAKYRVSVWNGAEESTGKEISLSYGVPWSIKYNLRALISSPVADEAYGFVPGIAEPALLDTLTAISTLNGTVLRTATIIRQFDGSRPLQGLTPDGSLLYWFDPGDNTLNRVRVSDFSAYPKLSIAHPSQGGYLLAVATNRVFEVTSDGTLVCLDATTGSRVGGSVATFGYRGVIALSPDGRTLYGATGDSRLYRYDVSADSFALTAQTSIPGIPQKVTPISNADAIGIYIEYNTVCVVDANSLALINTITSQDMIWDVCFTSTHAYVSTNNSVIEYDLRGGPTGRRWACANAPYLLVVDRLEATLYAEVSANGSVAVWAVPLR